MRWKLEVQSAFNYDVKMAVNRSLHPTLDAASDAAWCMLMEDNFIDAELIKHSLKSSGKFGRDDK